MARDAAAAFRTMTNRRRIARTLPALGAAALLAFIGSCKDTAQPGPVGICVRDDGLIVRRGVTESQCTDICPACSWEQADS